VKDLPPEGLRLQSIRDDSAIRELKCIEGLLLLRLVTSGAVGEAESSHKGHYDYEDEEADDHQEPPLNWRAVRHNYRQYYYK
jgi:hypothetical protein